ncbi:methyltransferase-like protein 27 [Amphiura filiformis]|uniref:methyltransferase-like protein 27 n=1 Tax=Amphiura filiformis TaxID=82378 RepID=UPI003B20D425
MSVYSTIQSRKFVLTKEEADYFANQDMKQYVNMIAMHRNQNTKDFAEDRETYYYEHGEHPCCPYISPYTVGLRAFANIISTFVSDKKCQMIDIAAGSGLLGFEMKKLGFENIDGLEPLEDMINMQISGIYGKLYRELISKETPTSIPTGSYDCAVVGAGIYAGHIEADALPEIIRYVKPGGFIILNIGDYWYRFKQFGPALETKLQQCLETGVLETVIKQRTIYMYNCDDANVYILKKGSNKIIENGIE